MVMNLKNLTNEQLDEMQREIKKEKEARLNSKRKEEWGRLLVEIQNYLNEFGEIEISDLNNTIVLSEINLTSPTTSSIAIDYNY